jgi:hypothetical protein
MTDIFFGRFVMKIIISLICSVLIAVTPTVASDKTPIILSIDAPHEVGSKGFLFTGGWKLIFKLEVKNAVALFEDYGSSALVIEDPDDCLHMGSFFSDSFDSPFEDGCLAEDELWILYTDPIQCTSLLDRPNLVVAQYPGFDQPDLQGVGPSTSGNCVGYGSGILSGLVVMANVGGARVFDMNFDRPAFFPAIRNMAGFFNPANIEPLGKGGLTTARTQLVVKNHFEPIILLDGSIAGHADESWFRLDSGPVEVSPYSPPIAPKVDHLINEVTVRAVIVEGSAPDIIIDMDGDGEYTARDLELSGYTMLSNPVQLDVVTKLTSFTAVDSDFICTHPFEPEAPPQNPFVYLSDLDDNGEAGVAFCSGSGASRSGIRIRR